MQQPLTNDQRRTAWLVSSVFVTGMAYAYASYQKPCSIAQNSVKNNHLHLLIDEYACRNV